MGLVLQNIVWQMVDLAPAATGSTGLHPSEPEVTASCETLLAVKSVHPGFLRLLP